MDRPQMFEHIQHSLNYTIYDVKWLPCSAKFVVLGMKPNSRGICQVFELNEAKVEKVAEFEKKAAFKCGTFRASNLRNRYMAIGDFNGHLHVIDIERPDLPVYFAEAHNGIINAIDGMGGKTLNCGPPEIVTGSRDGSVKIWDIRQSKPVVEIEPNGAEDAPGGTRDCWAVAFGDSYCNEERCVVAGYDNGDLKLFDLRAMTARWETSLKNGICGLEFDRNDIPMNKLGAVTLEGGLTIFDMRTQHPTKGFASVEEHNAGRSVGSNGIINGPKATVWAVRHLPQNRDIFATCGGTGSLRLWHYQYPDKRSREVEDGISVGVAGTLNMLHASTLSSQPINAMDWHPDKQGLAVCASFDQCVRVVITTKLNLFN